MGNIVKPIEHDYHTLRKEIYALVGRYPFLSLARIGKSVMGRELLALQLGKAKSYLLIAAAFHGTGDIYASATVGAMMRGFSIPEALSIAVDFTLLTMKKTLADKEHRFYGVNFEEALPYYIERINEK